MGVGGGGGVANVDEKGESCIISDMSRFGRGADLMNLSVFAYPVCLHCLYWKSNC